MKTSYSTITMTAIIMICLGLAGCSGQNGDRPDLGLVEGTITFEGKALPGAAVTFHPASGRPAMGKTNDQGHYTLNYIRDTPGTKVGFNKVEIATVSEGADEMASEGDNADQSKPKANVEILPARYNTKTELEVEVKKGKNTFDFALTK